MLSLKRTHQDNSIISKKVFKMNEEQIKAKLLENKLCTPMCQLSKLSGDASSREYYRLQSTDDSKIVCVESADGQQSSDFNLITSLINKKIKTPEILYYDKNFSILVLEDVGDVSLKDYFLKEGLAFHLQAIRDIKKYQDLELSVCQNRIFDREKIGFEFDLACNFFIKQHANIVLSENEEGIVQQVREFIIEFYENHRQVVCHRDYHSNNLYVKDDELFHIDYQDMRVGPRFYDLVSLVDDCYIDFSDEQRESLLNAFEDNFIDKNAYEYHIVQVQRTFKALGSFAFLNIEKGKPGYLVHIPSNIKKLQKILKESEIACFRSFSKILERGQYAA